MTEAVDMMYDSESPTFRRTPTVSFAGREVTCAVGVDGNAGTTAETYSEGYLHAHTFTVAGQYECYCSPHQSLRLRGSFEVR